ncbi:MAG: flavin reductase family protein [Saprospiraceae bacterium]|nr:flavin reductase family protein [Saprospiraceae bacterium]
MTVSKLKIKRLSQVMGQFATGLSVVTTQIEGQIFAQQVRSFTAVSNEPPLILFCLPKSASIVNTLREHKFFAVNVLPMKIGEANHRDASINERFGQEIDLEATTKSPIFRQPLAWLDCELRSIQDGGNHYILIGKVRDLDYQFADSPLLHFTGKYQNILEV